MIIISNILTFNFPILTKVRIEGIYNCIKSNLQLRLCQKQKLINQSPDILTHLYFFPYLASANFVSRSHDKFSYLSDRYFIKSATTVIVQTPLLSADNHRDLTTFSVLTGLCCHSCSSK